MSSILPQIKTLESIPSLHLNYAESLLKLIIGNLLQQEEIEIGTFIHGEDEGSVIAFDSNDSENVCLELCFSINQDFIINLTDNSEDINTSNFSYKFDDSCSLYEIVPENLREWMNDIAFSQEGKSYSLKK